MLKGRNVEKEGRLEFIGNLLPRKQGARCLPNPHLKVNSTGVQGGGPVESRQLGSNYNGSTVFISRLHFNHNSLLRRDLPEEAAHFTPLGGLALGTVRSSGSTVPPLKRDRLLAGGPECYLNR